VNFTTSWAMIPPQKLTNGLIYALAYKAAAKTTSSTISAFTAPSP